MIWGHIHIWLWIVLFIITILYEALTVKCVIAISKLQSFVVANISIGLSAISMGCVSAYTGEMNNCVPILVAVYIGNYYAVEIEKRKRAKEEKEKKSE